MEELLTLKEIAKHLGVPESNLRYYRNRIGDFLPSAGKGRRRRYFPEAEEIFRKTIEYVSEGVTLDRIYAIFAENKPLALKEDIARPAQEELARIIVEKLKAEEGLFQAPQGDQSNNAEIVGAIAQLRVEIAWIKERLEQAPLEQNPVPDAELQEEMARLRSRAHDLEDENQALKEKIDQVERIADGQKKALIEAREKRLALTQELDQLRQGL